MVSRKGISPSDDDVVSRKGISPSEMEVSRYGTKPSVVEVEVSKKGIRPSEDGVSVVVVVRRIGIRPSVGSVVGGGVVTILKGS